MTKRIIRIYPAYLVTILIIILLALFTSGFQVKDTSINMSNILLHTFFLNDLLGKDPALSPVFWTLAIEFQYYLLVIFLYPLITSSKSIYKISIALVLCGLPFAFSQKYILFSWLLLFNFGILAFQLKSNSISLFQYIFMTIFTAILSCYNKDILVTSVGLTTSILITFINIPRIKFFDFLGNISYSLYLLHFTIGIRVINLISRLGVGDNIKIVGLIVSLFFSFFAAYLIYKYVEIPTQKYFKNIKYSS